MKNNNIFNYLYIITLITLNFSCTTKDTSSQSEQKSIQEQNQSSNATNKENINELEKTNSNINTNSTNTVREDTPSSIPSLTTEETLKLLQPTEAELNNKVNNEDQRTDINTQ